jgi:hypothetical protein
MAAVPVTVFRYSDNFGYPQIGFGSMQSPDIRDAASCKCSGNYQLVYLSLSGVPGVG